MPVLWSVVVPVKGTPDAKSRLEATPEQALAIAQDTVAAAMNCPMVASVTVVTAPGFEDVFTSLGATTITDPQQGLNAAFQAGLKAVARANGPVACLQGDIPALSPAELARALRGAEGELRSMVADADSTGTVLLAALAADLITPAFGEGSAARHAAAGHVDLAPAATAADAAALSGLRRDIDTREHLDAVRDRLGNRTREAFSM